MGKNKNHKNIPQKLLRLISFRNEFPLNLYLFTFAFCKANPNIFILFFNGH